MSALECVGAGLERSPALILQTTKLFQSLEEDSLLSVHDGPTGPTGFFSILLPITSPSSSKVACLQTGTCHAFLISLTNLLVVLAKMLPAQQTTWLKRVVGITDW